MWGQERKGSATPLACMSAGKHAMGVCFRSTHAADATCHQRPPQRPPLPPIANTDFVAGVRGCCKRMSR